MKPQDLAASNVLDNDCYWAASSVPSLLENSNNKFALVDLTVGLATIEGRINDPIGYKQKKVY